MAKCKNCNKDFHACGSCGLVYDYEYNYCSYWCFMKSKEFKRKRRKFFQLLEILPKKYYEVLHDDFFIGWLGDKNIDKFIERIK